MRKTMTLLELLIGLDEAGVKQIWTDGHWIYTLWLEEPADNDPLYLAIFQNKSALLRLLPRRKPGLVVFANES